MPRRILSVTAVMLALAAGATYAATGGLLLGPASTAKTRDFKGYYDGHKDTFLVTDVSNKTQATALNANYSAAIGRVRARPRSTSFTAPRRKGSSPCSARSPASRITTRSGRSSSSRGHPA